MTESGHKIRNQEAVHFITLTVINWIDLFSRPQLRDIIIKNLDYCQKEKGLIVYAYVIMTNHLHLIVKSSDGNLSGTLRDFKSYSSKNLVEAIKEIKESRRDWLLDMFQKAASINSRNKSYQVWIHGNHPIELFSNKFLDQKLDYIHNNPVRAGIVEKPEDYLYSSARNYCGMPSILNITKIE
jgi:REP element-mobilizing transposase RayT